MHVCWPASRCKDQGQTEYAARLQDMSCTARWKQLHGHLVCVACHRMHGDQVLRSFCAACLLVCLHVLLPCLLLSTMQIHLLGLGPARSFLRCLIQPPPDKAVEAALTGQWQSAVSTRHPMRWGVSCDALSVHSLPLHPVILLKCVCNFCIASHMPQQAWSAVQHRGALYLDCTCL